jgi:arylsulfatase A-like enzyme
MLAPYAGVEIPPFRYDPDEWRGKSAPFSNMLQRKSWSDEKLMLYKHYFYAMVTGVDMAFGKIRKALEEVGQWDDTLIVFSSDHGDMLGDRRMLGKGGNYYYDEVMRVPCVLHWPNGFGTGGRTIDGLIEKLDVLPTLLELCGGHVPDMMQGRSYAEALLAGQEPETREDVFAFSHPNCAMLRTKDYKYCRFPNLGTETVFDLQADPNEGCDVTAEKPEVVRELRTRMLDRLLDGCRSPREHVYLF